MGRFGHIQKVLVDSSVSSIEVVGYNFKVATLFSPLKMSGTAVPPASQEKPLTEYTLEEIAKVS